MHKPTLKCWICGGDATTGEHKTKKSDLKSVFGEGPLYYHDARKRKQVVQGLGAKILKSPSRLCASCNNTRTQPHDRAWEDMSEWIRKRQLKPGGSVRADRIFSIDARSRMRNVHHYFVKQFGRLIVEGDVKFQSMLRRSLLRS